MSLFPNLPCWNFISLLACDRLNDYKKFTTNFCVDFFCLRETKFWMEHSLSLPQISKLKLLSMEGSPNNFDCASGGHILLKWKADSLLF